MPEWERELLGNADAVTADAAVEAEPVAAEPEVVLVEAIEPEVVLVEAIEPEVVLVEAIEPGVILVEDIEPEAAVADEPVADEAEVALEPEDAVSVISDEAVADEAVADDAGTDTAN
jgi:hypothetical protein